MKKKNMYILKQNKVILENDVSNMTTRLNHNSTLIIYLIIIKVAQFRMVYNNRREKEDAKK